MDKKQIDKFKGLARELEVNEKEAAFDRNLRWIAKSEKPDKEKPRNKR